MKISLGRLIRVHRKSLGYNRIDELADDTISSGTISKIERDDPRVSEIKIDYLLSKLETSREKLYADLAHAERLNEQRSKRTLRASETILNQYGLKELTKVLALLKSVNTDFLCPNYSKSNYIYGKIRMKQKKYDKAKEYFNKAIDCPNGHPNVKSASYINLGLISFRENNIYQSLKYFHKAYKISTPVGRKKHVHHLSLCNVAFCYEKLGHYDLAKEAINILSEKYSEIEHPYTKAQYYLIKSNLLIEQGKYEEAISELDQGLEIADIGNLEQMCFVMWTNLGMVFKRLGICDAAENYFLHALDLENVISNQNLLVQTNLHLASLYIQQKKWKKADDLTHKAISLSEQFNDAFKQVDAYTMLGVLFHAQRKYGDAIVPLETAQKISQKYKFYQKEITVLKHLASCYQIFDKTLYLQCLEEINIARSKLKGEEIMIYLKGDEPGEA